MSAPSRNRTAVLRLETENDNHYTNGAFLPYLNRTGVARFTAESPNH